MRLAAAALAAALLAGCGAPAADGRPTVTVFAAASLTEALQAAAGRYRPAVLELSFAGSPSLVAQVQQGAPADVVVAADETSLEVLADRLDGPPVVVARNALAVVTEPGDPEGVRALGDLARDDLAVVLAAPGVPAGRAARAALDAAGVVVRPVSEEQDVKAVLAKVRLGEADAGVVYATDLASAGDDVGGFALPGAVTAYPAAVLRDAADPAAARALVDWLRGEEGRALLEHHGFLPP